MDCVSDNGDVFIGYMATLHWRKIALSYSSILLHPRNGVTRTATSLRTGATPVVSTSATRWTSRALGVEGTWQAVDRPVQRTLVETEAGSIDWRCEHPRAHAEIVLADGNRITGPGYVEHLAMSLPPQRLPIDELRWGRFLSDTDSMVWIDWRGPRPMSLVVHNGVALDAPVVTDSGVVSATGTPVLTLHDHQVLREGALLKTALASVPGIDRLFPARLRQTYECKWCSRGTLHTGDPANGWAIHEIVRFA